MYVCNMLGEDYKNNKVNIIMEEAVMKGFLTVKNNSIVYSNNKEDKNIFNFGLKAESTDNVYRTALKPKKTDITYDMIKDTDDNPLIIVVCKEIGVYEGVEADIRYLALSDDVIIAMLISGVCLFDGNPMQRCDVSNFEDKLVYKYTAKELKSLADRLFVQKGSKYCYSKDIVCPVLITHSAEGGFSAKKVKEPYFISKENFNKKQEEFEKEIQAKEEKIKLRKLKNAEAVKEMQERQQKEKEEKRKKASESAKSKRSSNKTSNSTTTNLGASDFLAAVKAIQEE